ncbi:hypothetical protein ADEAN_000165800 [Angomonas deanei]|uniref:Uncharacterized protein n=1 Tax=Angomonas deanei TaxID=59799 RepID=A0A7G2C4Z0_9TRYP|nr:hypothetical protein ADEAN_000165800 [Angomonas deanei]
MNEHGSLQSHFLESDTPFSGETSATRSTLSNGALSAYEPMNIQNFLTNFRGGDKGVFNQNHLSNTEVFPGNGRCTLPQNAASSKSLSGGVVLSNAVPSNIPPPPEEPSEEVAAPVIALNEEVLYHSFMSVNSMSLPLQNQEPSV